MAKIPTIKPVLGFQRLPDAEFIKQLIAIHDRLLGNTNFPTPPVELAAFKAGIDTLSTLVSDAADGGRKTIAAKHKQRIVLTKMVRQLGHYVEAASDGDPVKFSTSGFTAVAATPRTSPEPLPAPKIDWIDRGKASGQVVVKVHQLPKAVAYEVRYAIVGPSGPGAWTTAPLPSSKKATISNLTPGATYAFQARAIGRLGYTDYTDSMTFIPA